MPRGGGVVYKGTWMRSELGLYITQVIGVPQMASRKETGAGAHSSHANSWVLRQALRHIPVILIFGKQI